jgi:type I restriction enzyme S subunit
MLNYPDHWNVKNLGELGQIASGGTPSTKVLEYWDGNISWITPADLTNYNGKFIAKGKRNLSESGLKKSSAKILPKGTILFSSRAPIGYITISANDICTNQGFKNIIPSKEVFNEYLYYYLKSAKNIAIELASGTTFKELSAHGFAKIPVPVPPLPEQHRIVEKIEELFSELDNGIANLKDAKEQLKIYRQSLLKWAFEGRLTNEEVKEGELPEGWRVYPLNEIGNWKGGGTPSKSRNDFWENGNIPWVSPKDMKSKIIFTTIDKITSLAIKSSSTNLIESGSVLFVVRSGIIRRTLPVAITEFEVTINQDMQAFTPFNALPEYIYWFVQAKNDEIRKECSKGGTTVESIETFLLKRYPIPVSTLNEQKKIVNEIESRFYIVDQMEQNIDESLQQAEALRQSILKSAFEGRLVV